MAQRGKEKGKSKKVQKSQAQAFSPLA